MSVCVDGFVSAYLLVRYTGQYPIAEGDGLRYLTIGPMSRYAHDLYPMLRVMAGPDNKDDRVRVSLFRSVCPYECTGSCCVLSFVFPVCLSACHCGAQCVPMRLDDPKTVDLASVTVLVVMGYV